jgi:hypothetical protein
VTTDEYFQDFGVDEEAEEASVLLVLGKAVKTVGAYG